jgi:hypothetical protein
VTVEIRDATPADTEGMPRLTVRYDRGVLSFRIWKLRLDDGTRTFQAVAYTRHGARLTLFTWLRYMGYDRRWAYVLSKALFEQASQNTCVYWALEEVDDHE